MPMNAQRINAVIAPTPNQLNAAAVRKIRHPEAPYEYAQLVDDLDSQRQALATMAELITEDPETFDRYFDQVAETGEVRQEIVMTVKQVPARKRPARKRAVKKAAARKAIEPPKEKLAPGQTISVPIVPVPPPRPGAETVEQGE